jgi:tetratricopeptide (TPR) repeat protein
MKRHAALSDVPVQSLIAAFASSMLHLWVGDYAQAERDERTTLALYDLERDRNLVWRYNHDPRSTVLSWSAHRVWATGFPDRARALAEEAVSQARRIGHPFNLCWTLGNSSIALGASGDLAGARQRHEELLGIAEEENLDFIGAYMAPATLSVIAAQCEDYEASLADGQRAEAVWRSIGGRFWSPIVLASMGLAAARLGRSDQARGYVREATELLASTGEEMLAEEIYRIQGLVRLECDGDEAGALDSFERSLRFAGRHGTRSYELRTTISLAGLLADRGERQEAADLLSRAYESFNEGFGTRDLKAAKSLLSDLA